MLGTPELRLSDRQIIFALHMAAPRTVFKVEVTENWHRCLVTPFAVTRQSLGELSFVQHFVETAARALTEDALDVAAFESYVGSGNSEVKKDWIACDNNGGPSVLECLDSFNGSCVRYNVIRPSVQLTHSSSSTAVVEGKNAFDILLASGRNQSLNLPAARNGATNKKNVLFNDVRHFLEAQNCRFSSCISSQHVVEGITNALWYFDPHISTITSGRYSCVTSPTRSCAMDCENGNGSAASSAMALVVRQRVEQLGMSRQLQQTAAAAAVN